MEKKIEEKRCVLCNKPYSYKYSMFGRVCLDNMYSLLRISKSPRFIWNKELYLCTRIAWRNHKLFLNRNQKYNLTQKYIALSYLNKMECNFLDDIKEQIKNDINNISIFSKNVIETISFSLNDIYKLYNYWQKFNDLIANFQNINWKELDEKLAKEFIEINGIKNEDNTWNLDIEINDTYDFTEFKSLKEYVDEKEKILMDIFATTLNNLGVASSKYGVIKIFDVKLIFHLDSYKVDEMKVIT